MRSSKALAAAPAVPGSLLASWSSLPQLAWVAGRGSWTPALLRQPGRGMWARVLNGLGDVWAVPLVPFHLGYLVGVKLNRQLLSVNRHALMIAKPRGSEPARNAVLRAATMTAVALPTYLVATAAATIGLTIAGLPLGLATGIPVAWMTVPALGGVVLTIKGAWRARTDVKTVAGDRTGDAIELNSLAAWPQNSVHGGRLLHAVLAELPKTVPVVVSAGTPDLHTAYRRLAERYGFRTHQEGGSGLFITPRKS